MNIAFTGHRPNILYGYNMNDIRYHKLKLKVLEILNMLHTKYTITKAYSGGALGFDTLAFDCVANIKTIDNTLVIPFKGQDRVWNHDSRVKYFKMINDSTNYIVLDRRNGADLEKYEIVKLLQKRNEYMVDNCDILIACSNGDTKGGTANCIRYAKEQGKTIIIINPKTLEISLVKK